MTGLLPCGHPESAVVQGGEGTAYCRVCEALSEPSSFESQSAAGRAQSSGASPGGSLSVEADARTIRQALTRDPNARRRALARLRQDLWEASQHFPLAEIQAFVAQVIEEIASDEP